MFLNLTMVLELLDSVAFVCFSFYYNMLLFLLWKAKRANSFQNKTGQSASTN
jgi:hypothetical protein